MSKNLSVLLLIIVVGVFGGAVAQNGAPCHASIFQFTPRHNLNISAYMGDWYTHEIAGSDIGNFPAPLWKCAKRTLFLPNQTDITHIDAIDTFVNIADGVTTVEEMHADVNNTRSPFSAMWTMHSDHEGPGEGEVGTRVIVLAADLQFAQWSIVYSCSILGPDAYRYEVVMALTRNRFITPELRQFLKALMVGTGFRIGDHHPVDQLNCNINP